MGKRSRVAQYDVPAPYEAGRYDRNGTSGEYLLGKVPAEHQHPDYRLMCGRQAGEGLRGGTAGENGSRRREEPARRAVWVRRARVGFCALLETGADGSVRVLRCHTDRTKRIATENSPYLFLTVSEDGTVRQHDLRRPHNCRSECPEALFRAPRNVDLYSLSVSTVTPHMFAVAGRTDCVS